MADLLIKGGCVTMPTNCMDYCRFCEDDMICRLTGREISAYDGQFGREDFCPLVEVKEGKWTELEEDVYECSVCGEAYILDDTPKVHKYHFCPNCGAKMEVEHE